jgi:hypothetical protein
MNSDDDFSDLTDLDSDDEYKAKPKKKTGPKAAKDGGYRIKNALKVPRATTYTAQSLYGEKRPVSLVFTYNEGHCTDQIHNCDVNLEPEYQRGIVLVSERSRR